MGVTRNSITAEGVPRVLQRSDLLSRTYGVGRPRRLGSPWRDRACITFTLTTAPDASSTPWYATWSVPHALDVVQVDNQADAQHDEQIDGVMLGIDMLGVDARHASVDGRIVLDGTAQPGAAAGAPEQTAKPTPNMTFS